MTSQNNALIGYSGFVGSTLLRQTDFFGRYRSTNIAEVGVSTYDMVVCAAAPAQKWIANRDPEVDRDTIDRLIGHLDTVRCNTFVLISTVDVFKHPVGVDELSAVEEDGLHAYGLNRRRLEKFVEGRFENTLIVRLPGLVGPGLRKNVIFDFLNDNNLDAIDSRGSFQFYPMVNLWYDIERAMSAGLRLVHLTAAPVAIADVAKLGFNREFERNLGKVPASYDMRTRYAALFDVEGAYQYSARETIQAVRAYAQSEARTLPATSSPIRGAAS